MYVVRLAIIFMALIFNLINMSHNIDVLTKDDVYEIECMVCYPQLSADNLICFGNYKKFKNQLKLGLYCCLSKYPKISNISKKSDLMSIVEKKSPLSALDIKIYRCFYISIEVYMINFFMSGIHMGFVINYNVVLIEQLFLTTLFLS